MKRALFAGALLAISAASIVATTRLAEQHAGVPLRCGDGLVAIGARCCGEGQTLSGDMCVGAPSRCAATQERTHEGCVARRHRVTIAGGTLTLGPADWEAQGVVDARELRVGTIDVDAFELDIATHAACVAAGACRGPTARGDAGRAAVLSFDEAKALCAFTGGRLPKDDEWTFIAMGAAARRYPWGDTGLVCSRAAFGLVDGPCARGAKSPDLAGARPAGKSPDGVYDLAGNVAEWTIAADGSARARGGSVGSRLPSDFRGWQSAEAAAGALVGARCVRGEP